MVKDEELLADCKRCCTEDDVSTRFTSAILEVCPYRIGSFPQIKDFIDKHSTSFKKQLSVRYEHGVAPRLRMKAKGESETIRIDNWKATSILEYLGSKLTKEAAT